MSLSGIMRHNACSLEKLWFVHCLLDNDMTAHLSNALKTNKALGKILLKTVRLDSNWWN